MENASKALVMAGSVLIALMIIGALLLTYNGIKNYQKEDTIDLATAQTAEFNNQFITYNRDNVRGNDLYSLLNRVVDYNERKTTEGSTTDARETIGYTPVTVNIDFVSTDNLKQFAMEDNLLIKNVTYSIKKTSKSNNAQDDFKFILDEIREIEDTYGGASVASKITSSITKIFIDDTETEKKKENAVSVLNSITEKTYTWDDIKPGSQMREDIYTYYEYVQFKRGIFKCTDVEYEKSTGRIIRMDFEYTGKLQ